MATFFGNFSTGFGNDLVVRGAGLPHTFYLGSILLRRQ